ncbi:hypothetical protein [Halorhabdus salina]|uniref:hypothetical protein n=1 Tax=Halorhabdus salina TaxID=2750670 RepID=UPI0015EFAE2B|nr:hypothetical protein [Halorhabdus salina]
MCELVGHRFIDAHNSTTYHPDAVGDTDADPITIADGTVGRRLPNSDTDDDCNIDRGWTRSAPSGTDRHRHS